MLTIEQLLVLKGSDLVISKEFSMHLESFEYTHPLRRLPSVLGYITGGIFPHESPHNLQREASDRRLAFKTFLLASTSAKKAI